MHTPTHVSQLIRVVAVHISSPAGDTLLALQTTTCILSALYAHITNSITTRVDGQ